MSETNEKRPMTEQISRLSACTEAQRERALHHFSLIRPFLQGDVRLTHLASTHHLSLRTLRQWVQQYRRHGLIGLVRKGRSDRGKRRGLPADLVQLIEGLALQEPKRSIAAIHRQITKIAMDHDWPQPSYGCVYDIIRSLDKESARAPRAPAGG